MVILIILLQEAKGNNLLKGVPNRREASTETIYLLRIIVLYFARKILTQIGVYNLDYISTNYC